MISVRQLSFYIKFSLFVTASIFLIISCSKSDSTANSTTEPDIYVCGEELTNPSTYFHTAKFWRNGIETILSPGIYSANAYGMATNSNDDIYIVGSLATETSVLHKSEAVYWKNGVITILGNTQDNSIGSSIFVDGSDIYVAGWENYNGGYSVVRLWKNGVGSFLSDGSVDAIGKSIFVSGSDVYIAGFYDEKPMIYKNNVRTMLPSNILKGQVNALFVSGNDVYAVGGLLTDEASRIYAPVYWKNGVLFTPEGLDVGEISAITIVGNNVYMAGHYHNSGAVWKNGIRMSIPNISEADYLGAIAIRNSDIYVVGPVYVNSSNVIKVYKNGEAMALTSGNYFGYPSGIILQH